MYIYIYMYMYMYMFYRPQEGQCSRRSFWLFLQRIGVL